jgi:hypothetical protein
MSPTPSHPRPLHTKSLLVTAGAALACSLAPARSDADTLVRLLAVGAGDGIVIYCPVKDTKNAAELKATRKILIDFGSTSRLAVPRYDIKGTEDPKVEPNTANLDENLKDALENSQGKAVADFAVFTHGDSDHFNRFSRMLGKGEVTASAAFVSGADKDWTTKIGMSFFDELKKLNHNFRRPAALPLRDGFRHDATWAGTIPQCGDNNEHLDFRIIAANAGGETDDDKNRRSAVVLMRHVTAGKTTDFWFTGDATTETEAAIVRNYAYDAAVRAAHPERIPLTRPDEVFLKVAHHGSPTSSSIPFLAFLTPITRAFVSANAGYATYGLPQATVITAINQRIGGTAEHSIPCWSDAEQDGRTELLRRKRKFGDQAVTACNGSVESTQHASASDPTVAVAGDLFIRLGGAK